MITNIKSNRESEDYSNLKLTAFLTALFTLILLPVANAAHTVDLSVSPEYMAGGSNKTLRLTLENDNTSMDSIWQVKIVKNGNYQAECFKPEGWSLDSQPGYCTYTTTDKIQPGSSETFALKVTAPKTGGAYNWDIYTTDSASPNEGSSVTVTTKVDTQPPQTTLKPNGTFASGPQASFSLSCEDSRGDVASGCFKSFYSVTEKTKCPALNYTQATSGSMSCTDQVCRRQVCYYSIDRAGNWEQRKMSSDFVIDAAQPSISQLQVKPHFKVNETNYVRGKISLSARVSDKGAGLNTVGFQITGEGVSRGCQGSRGEDNMWSCSLDTLGIPDGSYTLFVVAKDKVGNQASKEGYQFSVSNQEPIVKLIEGATIRFSYSDAKLEGIKEDTLQLYHYNREEGSWEEVSAELNTEENYVSMPLSDVSQFTLFGEMGAAEEEPKEDNETEEECQPNWSCSAWGDCVNGTRSRDCTDLNDCGTEQGKPQTTKDCVEICQPDWNCSSWSDCVNGTRSRNCTDLNQCDIDENKPVEVKGCEGCQKNWVCTDWSEIECTNGTKTRECIEWNNCAGEEELPTKNETIECGQQEPVDVGGMSARRKLGIAVLVILIVIIALVLYYR